MQKKGAWSGPGAGILGHSITEVVHSFHQLFYVHGFLFFLCVKLNFNWCLTYIQLYLLYIQLDNQQKRSIL